MAKSSHSKIVCATPRNDTQRKVTKPTTKGTAASKPESYRPTKGWVHCNHPPDQSKNIKCDPKDPKNIIHGKRTRNGSRVNESQLGKATHSIILPDDDNISIQRANAEAASPPAPHKHTQRASEKSVEEPAPDTYSDGETKIHTEEDNTGNEISPRALRRGIIALVNHSLQIADDVAGYMQFFGGNEEQAEELDCGVNEVLIRRVKKWRAEEKAQKGKGSKNVRFAA